MKYEGPGVWREGTSLYGYGSFAYKDIDWDNVKNARATFSNHYSLDGNGNFGYKLQHYEVDGDNYPGKWDMPSCDVEIDKVNKIVNINLTKDYGLLKIKTNSYKRSRINITNFTTPDNFIKWPFPVSTSENNYSHTVNVGGDGFIYLYGKWEEVSEIQLVYKEYGKLKQITEKLPSLKKE